MTAPSELSSSPDLKHVLEPAHEALTEAFLRFQERLICLELDLARTWLKRYRRMLRAHIQAEEELLFPLFYSLVPEPPRGTSPPILRDEHSKLTRLLEELIAQLEHPTQTLAHWRDATRPGSDASSSSPPSSVRRETLEVLERSITLAHVAEHHHLREENLIAPALASALSAPAAGSSESPPAPQDDGPLEGARECLEAFRIRLLASRLDDP